MFFQFSQYNIASDLITIIKIFSGDVYGSYVRDTRITGNTQNIGTINARIDAVYSKPFLTTLHTKYIVDYVVPTKSYNGVVIRTYKISPRGLIINFTPIVLDLVLMSPKLFNASFLDFDVNLVTENETSLYVRYIPHTIKHVPDKLGFISDRIRSKCFGCLDTVYAERALQDVVSLVEGAIDLTHKNWVMDDMYSSNTWVVGTWENMLNGRNRKKRVLSHDCSSECALCHEQFKPTDIVFNTVCTHNYHWRCNNNNGLYFWVNEHGQTSCPYCRSNIFYL